ncbi:hypothetical protein FRX31_024939 [Thalictrum thalictroides]|uniref:Uncharacterized protein n=1 Tax=Thalictrum thalictroides TaxID=46969 RepID=A0A7J6VK57_THATH|nr:hypothetical protein FRX31_024939 [Thalictrum thalictroides]
MPKVQQCQLQNVDALEPTRKQQSEAGVTEYWDENNEQLQCAGTGRGIHGAVIPGCPGTFHLGNQNNNNPNVAFQTFCLGGNPQQGRQHETRPMDIGALSKRALPAAF